MAEYDLPVWDPAGVPSGASLLFIAARRGGKSVLFRHIFESQNWKRRYKAVIVCCGSRELLREYATFTGPNSLLLCFDSANAARSEAVLEEVWARLDGNRREVCIVFDDVPKARKLDVVTDCFATGRHRLVTVVILAQRFSLMAPTWRSNADLTFLGKTMPSDREPTAKMFLRGAIQHVNTTAQTMEALKNLTLSHCFIVLDELDRTTKQYLAPPPPKKKRKKRR